MVYLSNNVKFTLFYLQIIILEIISPFVVFLTLESHIGPVIASLLTPLPILLSILITLTIYNIIEPLSLLFFGICLIGGLLTFILGDPLYCQVSIAILNILIGCSFLVTEWWAPKPLTFYFGRPWFSKNQKQKNMEWSARWLKNPNFRYQLKVNSYMWSLGFILLGGISLILLFTLELNLSVILILILTFLQLILNGGFSYIFSRFYKELDSEKVEFAKV